MYNKKICFESASIISILICCLSLSLFIVSGCTPLRKKFIRERKKDKNVGQRFIPVLDPLDYPEKVYSSQERYKHHYSLWKVWNRDLLQVLERDGSQKRQKYLLNQSIEQLSEMKKWLADEKQIELNELINDMRKIQRLYEKPSSMRNKFSTRRKIELNAKAIRHNFSPKVLLLYRK